MTQLLSQPRLAWLLLLAGSIAGVLPPEQVALCLGADGHFAMSRGGPADADCPCGPESSERSLVARPDSAHPSCRDFDLAGTSLGLEDFRSSLERVAPLPQLPAPPAQSLEPTKWERAGTAAERRAGAGILRFQRSVVLLI